MKIKGYRLAIVDSEPQARSALADGLENAGHQIVVDTADLASMVKGCLKTYPDLIIIESPLNGAYVFEAIELIRQRHDVPCILMSRQLDVASVQRASESRVFAYLQKPVRPEELEATVQLAVSQHRHLASLCVAVETAKQQLADRKVIERAKGLIMTLRGLSEQEAYIQLKRAARNERQQVAVIARGILMAEGLLLATENDQPERR